MSHQTKKLIVFILLCLTLVTGHSLLKNRRFIFDEKSYNNQIQYLLKKNLIFSNLREVGQTSTLPTYGFTLAACAKIFNNDSIQSLRLYSMVLSILSIIFFYQLSMQVAPAHALTKTLQYSFFPTAFPLFFLVYTDMTSMSFILLALWATLKRWRWAAAFFGFLSVLIRQNNIVWYLFFFLCLYVEENGTHFSWDRVKQHLLKNWGFLVGFSLFALFIILNQGSIAIGDKKQHPAFSFHLGNIYFSLFIFFFLFLPFNLSNFKLVCQKILLNKKIIPLLLIAFLFYMGSFQSTHAYNSSERDYFLRNQILAFLMSTPWAKALAFIPMVYSALSLWVTCLRHPFMIWVYPFSALFLLPSWLIDPRYYLIPFTFFILFREQKSLRVEYGTVVYSVILSFVLFYKISTGRFFF